MSYENFLIREMIYGDYRGIAENDLCDDCGQRLDRCACESMSDWLRTVDSGEDVCVPASPEIHAQSFGEWLESHGDSLTIPDSFQAWLDQTGDTIQ